MILHHLITAVDPSYVLVVLKHNNWLSDLIIAEGLAQWLRSLPPNPEVPGSIPDLVEGWIFGWPSFPLKFTQLSILPGSVKWVPAYMDRFEAAARGAYICFWSAGGKLIIVKRLWACYMEKVLYKCTTFICHTTSPSGLKIIVFAGGQHMNFSFIFPFQNCQKLTCWPTSCASGNWTFGRPFIFFGTVPVAGVYRKNKLSKNSGLFCSSSSLHLSNFQKVAWQHRMSPLFD